jgi:prophage maintenance system killer protein
MMRYLSFEEVIALHAEVIFRSGGILGIRDRGGLESAVAQPQMTFDGHDLYPSISEKAAALVDSFRTIRFSMATSGSGPLRLRYSLSLTVTR